MKIKLAFVAITVAVMGVIGCQSDPDAGPLNLDPCKIASEQSPTWERFIIEATRDDGVQGEALTRFCQDLLTLPVPPTNTEEV